MKKKGKKIVGNSGKEGALRVVTVGFFGKGGSSGEELKEQQNARSIFWGCYTEWGGAIVET